MNILVIGIGHHAKRIYLPTLHALVGKYDIKNIVGLDLVGKEGLEKVAELYPSMKIEYIDYLNMPKAAIDGQLKSIKDKYNIDTAIISTDPINHYNYIEWCIDNDVHCLADKPIVLTNCIVSDKESIISIRNQFSKLINAYKTKKNSGKPNLQCEIMCQRRYHKGYQLAMDKVQEVFKKTNCPITYINSFHSDGQWRFPDEVIEQDYHPYNQGYGKCGHSGYHTIDVASWLIKSTTNPGKEITNYEVYAQSAFPVDVLHQFNFSDYHNLFPHYNTELNTEKYENQTHGYGDIDTQASISYKHGKRVQTIASINLVHNGFSQRNWISAKDKDLYKGNGRIRQEFFMIEQGPFQSIFIESFQSNEINKDNLNLYEHGGEHHFDIHIYRNSTLFPEYQTHEHLTIKDLYKDFNEGYGRGHNENARRDGIDQFLSCCQTGEGHSYSNLLDHELSASIFHSIYESINNRHNGSNPLILNSL